MNTQLMARLTVDGSGDATVGTGLPALDHLLGVLARYARFDLALEVAPGSPQEQIEAAGQALGDALRDALREPGAPGHGIGGVPSGEALAWVALDRSERPQVVSNVDLSSVHVAGLSDDVIAQFSERLAAAAGIVLHVRLAHGEEEHHVLDSIFKALGVALGQACRP
jgi:imidazoleglycerol-phosphate dehydratase